MANSEAIATAKADLMKAGLLGATDADALIALTGAKFDLGPNNTDRERNEHIANIVGLYAVPAVRALSNTGTS